MIAPEEAFRKINTKFGKKYRIAFLSTLIVGLIVHFPVMLSDIPNHDGLEHIYSSQNMITSGRWFLTVACGISSYFTVPWVIGLIGLLFLACAGMVLADLFELESPISIAVCGGLLATFPSLASTFAYIFALDGYMMALFLAVLSVWLAGRGNKGWIAGGFCLAFSMGVYQAYLPFAILLCCYRFIMLLVDGKWSKERRTVLQRTGEYLGMGILGVALYAVILRVLLMLCNKELDSYQGIGKVGFAQEGFAATMKALYMDFATFALKKNILFQNLFSATAMLCLVMVTVAVVMQLASDRHWFTKPGFYLFVAGLAAVLPIATGCIRIVSPELNYHLLMRYHWVLFPIAMLAFCEKGMAGAEMTKNRFTVLSRWAILISGVVLLFCYGLADNIGYSNLGKKYEKTYAYCVRLLDRIEQTDGYYQGIPVVIIGVVGNDPYPVTDLTQQVTGNMTGLGLIGESDYLLNKGADYEAFIKNYLGATLNIVADEKIITEVYDSEEYINMESFPGAGSTKVVNGKLYVKTENFNR